MSLAGRARTEPCLDVDGIASSRMLPLSVVSCKGKFGNQPFTLTTSQHSAGGLTTNIKVSTHKALLGKIPNKRHSLETLTLLGCEIVTNDSSYREIATVKEKSKEMTVN